MEGNNKGMKFFFFNNSAYVKLVVGNVFLVM